MKVDESKSKVFRIREDGDYRLIYSPLDYRLSVDNKNFDGVDDRGIASLVTNFDPVNLNFPVRIVGEITSRCNQRCTNCSQRDNARGASMDSSYVYRIIDEADKFKTFELSLRGAEATLHPDFNNIWNYASKKEFISLTLLTNGILLDEQRVLSMLDNKRSKVVVSLDGFEDVNAVTRSSNQYSKVMEWLLPVLSQKPEQITVLSTVSKYNCASLLEFSKYLSDNGLKYQNFTFLKRLGDKELPSLGLLSLNEMYSLEKSLKNITEQNPAFVPTISSPYFKDGRNMLSAVPIQLFTEYYCGSGMKIMNDGRVGISQMIHFDQLSNSEYGHLYQKDQNCLGRLSEGKSLFEIWNSNKQLRAEQAVSAKKNFKYFLGLEKNL